MGRLVNNSLACTSLALGTSNFFPLHLYSLICCTCNGQINIYQCQQTSKPEVISATLRQVYISLINRSLLSRLVKFYKLTQT